MHLAGLFIHPVKSLRGCAVETADVDPLGLVGDRRFLVVDETGRFLTQRTLPRMALIDTALSADTLTLSAAGGGSCLVPRAAPPSGSTLDPSPRPPPRRVSVWKSEDLLADDCGDGPAAWLSDFLGTRCRLVRIGAAFIRPILKLPAALAATPSADHVVSFADAFPFLLLSEASLADLNDRLVAAGGDALPMNRFRPNLVVSGCDAFAEDTWPRLRIGEVVLRAAGPCTRCVMTTTDQLTGERGREPLRTLARYRRNAKDPADVDFGQNLIHETKCGTLRVGDCVEALA